MKHTAATDCFEIFCSEHRPYSIEIEENKSFWEKIDSIN